MSDNNLVIRVDNFDSSRIEKLVVLEILNSIDIEQFKREIKNKLVKELKGDIVNSKEVTESISTAIEKVNKITDTRINQAVSKKIEEIQNIDFGKFELKLK